MKTKITSITVIVIFIITLIIMRLVTNLMHETEKTPRNSRLPTISLPLEEIEKEYQKINDKLDNLVIREDIDDSQEEKTPLPPLLNLDL